MMTVRENLHQLVETLPEERLEDIRAGRTITLEDYRRTRGL